MHNWGEPTYESDFDGNVLDPTWHAYGPEPGNEKAGIRTPEAIRVADGLVTITGDERGNTGAMKWFPGQKYGRWEGCLKVGAAGNAYHALFLLWPDAEDWPKGGEIDWVEIFKNRNEVNWFLHYDNESDQTSDQVTHTSTEWTAWALEWTPSKMTAYVNGKVWHEETDPRKFPPAAMDFCIQLDNFKQRGVSSMSVDWTRQWALPESEPSKLGLRPGETATGQPQVYPQHRPRMLSVTEMEH